MEMLVFLLVLSILVTIHELGHFVTAKLLGIKVEEFALGLPFTKPVFQTKRGETEFSIYPLLFGGFVRLHGEETSGKDKKRSFWDRGKRQRVLVLAAGIVMNLVLAVVGFAVFYGLIGLPVSENQYLTIVGIAKDSPASQAGFLDNDRIIAVEGKQVATVEDFRRIITSWQDLSTQVTVQRGKTVAIMEGFLEQDSKETLVLNVVPKIKSGDDRVTIGVNLASYPYIKTEKCYTLSCAAGYVTQGIKATGTWGYRVIDGLRSIGRSLAKLEKPEGVSGPIGIYQITGMVAAQGIIPLIELTAVLSVNLAVFNLLPIPALDGGRIFFVVIEAIRRKRISPDLEAKVNAIGMAFLLGVLALVSLQDVIRLGIWDKLIALTKYLKS